MPRPLHAVPAVPGPGLYAALRAALAGTGPAVLPVPAEPVQAARVAAALRPHEPVDREDVALVVPTSGSTGEPKGVLLTAAALRTSADAALERLGGAGRWLLALPVTHIGGLQVVLRSLLHEDVPLALPAGPFSAAAFCAGTARLGPGRRYTSLVPTQLGRLLAAGPQARAALATYDAVLVGGAALGAGLQEAARDGGIRLTRTYGMSETSGGCVYDGVPLAGVRVAVADDAGIRLGGPVLALGYRGRPDLTARQFVDGSFRTGDVGRWEGDRLVVDGRADDLVVTGGEKVAPAAVEAALSRHPAVASVAVLGRPDPEWGQRVVAFVVPAAGQSLSLEQAREHVAAVLSRVAAPRELRLLPELPLLPSGKVDRPALAGLG